MPLTPFQSQILLLLARNRSPESYVAGGLALNAREDVRWSADVDVFCQTHRARLGGPLPRLIGLHYEL